MEKEFRRFGDLQVAGDGEVILESGKHTYGYKTPDGHRVVKYKGKEYFVHRLVAECLISTKAISLLVAEAKYRVLEASNGTMHKKEEKERS